MRRNPSSSGGNTYLDAFDIAGSLLQASTRYQQADSKVTWAGSWATNTSTSLSGGSYAGAGPGAIMLARFDGTALDLIGTLSPYGGIAEVSIDGGHPSTPTSTAERPPPISARSGGSRDCLQVPTPSR